MRSILNKRIPTLLGILLLVIGVLTTSYLVNTGVILFGGAAPTENPEDVRITNISDSTFTVTYKTEAKVIGTISLQNAGGVSQTILDERDQQSGVPKLYRLHSISLKNAKPDTTYAFSITSGTTTYQNNGSLFSAKTGSVVTASPSATAPLTGKVLDANGNIPEEAFIFVTTQGGQSLSALSQSNGIYILPLNAMRTNSLSSYLSLTPQTMLQLLLTDGSQNSQAQVLVSGANPVPLMTLSNNYNFVSSPSPIASTEASFGFPPFPNAILEATPIITTPKKDQSFTDTQPQFAGKGLPNQSVTIEIHSDALITATTTTDASGNWLYRPSQPLAPGPHTISITTKNAAGILQTIEQSFTVFASGSQVTQSATPSATIQPTPTVVAQTPTITSTPLVSPTANPLLTTVTPTKAMALRPKPTIPPTGNNTLVISSFFAIATTLVGIVLFVITKGAGL